MTYPGTHKKTFLEICEEQAAEGNPAAAAFVAKKKHKLPPAVVITDAITKHIDEEGFKYIGAIDPDIEAEIEAAKEEKPLIHPATKMPYTRCKTDQDFFKPIPKPVKPYDPDNPDHIPF